MLGGSDSRTLRNRRWRGLSYRLLLTEEIGRQGFGSFRLVKLEVGRQRGGSIHLRYLRLPYPYFPVELIRIAVVVLGVVFFRTGLLRCATASTFTAQCRSELVPQSRFAGLYPQAIDERAIQVSLELFGFVGVPLDVFQCLRRIAACRCQFLRFECFQALFARRCCALLCSTDGSSGPACPDLRAIGNLR